MSGVKGKSGGPRKNSGGARPGAGRKPKAKPGESANAPGKGGEADPAPLPVTDEPLAFLLAVQNHPTVDIKTRVRAAIAAAQYKHTKRGDGGKKDDQADKAKKAAQGRFGPRKPPLALVNGGR
jgi:phage terminase small subunit